MDHVVLVHNECVPSQHVPYMYTGVYAFVILKDGAKGTDEEIVKALKEMVKKKIAAFAVPTAFLVSWGSYDIKYKGLISNTKD